VVAFGRPQLQPRLPWLGLVADPGRRQPVRKGAHATRAI